MIFSEKLQLLRKNKGLTQEETAEKLNVSRQAVAKWESGQAYPDIANLIRISDLLNVSVDYLVRDQDCSIQAVPARQTDVEKLIAFRLEANVNTYAAFKNEVDSTRPQSHDFRYTNGSWLYHDTYVGGERFAGEEAIWHNGVSVYAMNYMGRVLSDSRAARKSTGMKPKSMNACSTAARSVNRTVPAERKNHGSLYHFIQFQGGWKLFPDRETDPFPVRRGFLL